MVTVVYGHPAMKLGIPLNFVFLSPHYPLVNVYIAIETMAQ